jgi:hypothetical protein
VSVVDDDNSGETILKIDIRGKRGGGFGTACPRR